MKLLTRHRTPRGVDHIESALTEISAPVIASPAARPNKATEDFLEPPSVEFDNSVTSKTTHFANRWKTVRSAQLMWLLGWILTSIGIGVSVAGGAPVLSHPMQPLWLGFGGALIIAGGAALAESWSMRNFMGEHLGWKIPAIIALVLSVFILGVLNTEVISGKPILRSSEQAQVHQFSQQTLERLYRIGEIDTMFELDQIQGRLKTQELESMYREVEEWNTQYHAAVQSGVDDDDLATINIMMSETSGQTLRAIDLQLNWLKTGDPVARRAAAEHRVAFQTGVLETGLILRDVTAQYGIVVGDIEGGLVE